jgi:hypothetical protein
MRRARRDARGKAVLGAALIGVAMLALAGLAVGGLWLRAPPLDADTLCRTDQPLAAHTIILVDSTDKLEPRHRRRLRAVAEQERARLAEYERLTVLRIDWRHPQEPDILFSKCLPKAPEDTNPLFENARLAKQRWDAEFQSKMDAALRNAAHGGAAQASPILAALAAAAADPDFGAEIAHRRLVLVSDLLEHDPHGFSLYVAGADYRGWLAQHAGGPPDLSSVDVRVAPLDRPDHAAAQAAARENFWAPYLDATTARSVSFDPSA